MGLSSVVGHESAHLVTQSLDANVSYQFLCPQSRHPSVPCKRRLTSGSTPATIIIIIAYVACTSCPTIFHRPTSLVERASTHAPLDALDPAAGRHLFVSSPFKTPLCDLLDRAQACVEALGRGRLPLLLVASQHHGASYCLREMHRIHANTGDSIGEGGAETGGDTRVGSSALAVGV